MVVAGTAAAAVAMAAAVAAAAIVGAAAAATAGAAAVAEADGTECAPAQDDGVGALAPSMLAGDAPEPADDAPEPATPLMSATGAASLGVRAAANS